MHWIMLHLHKRTRFTQLMTWKYVHFVPYIYIYMCMCSKIDRNDVVFNVSIKYVCRQFVSDNQVEYQLDKRRKKGIEKQKNYWTEFIVDAPIPSQAESRYRKLDFNGRVSSIYSLYFFMNELTKRWCSIKVINYNIERVIIYNRLFSSYPLIGATTYIDWYQVRLGTWSNNLHRLSCVGYFFLHTRRFNQIISNFVPDNRGD